MMTNQPIQASDSCAQTGCIEPRKSKPLNPKFKQSKYCVGHAKEARANFWKDRGVDVAAQKDKYAEFEKVWNEALEAGKLAGDSVQVAAMVVEQHENMLDDNSPVVMREVVSGGVCGMASIVVSPATSSFARWVVKNKTNTGRNYYGGLTVYHVHEYNQSLTRKEAFASAFARVLSEKLGVKARVNSRMD